MNQLYFKKNNNYYYYLYDNNNDLSHILELKNHTPPSFKK